MGAGCDVLGGEVGFVSVGWQQRGDLSDGGIVAAGEVLGRIGDGRRERGAEGMDDLVVGVAGELEGQVGCGVVHGRVYIVIIDNCQCY